MEPRLAALVIFGVFGVVAWYFEWAPEGYALPWLLIGVVALGCAAVVVFRNRGSKPGKHS